jgi:hypothetical protein
MFQTSCKQVVGAIRNRAELTSVSIAAEAVDGEEGRVELGMLDDLCHFLLLSLIH